MKRTRKFQAAVDSLEARTVLSTAQPAAHIIPLRGSGVLTTTGSQNVTGGINASVSMAAKFAKLGNSTGQLTVNVPTGNLNFSATGVITVADGDQIDINFAGGSETPKPRATRAVGQFQVNITGGTGAFTGLNGIGKITVIQNLDRRGNLHDQREDLRITRQHPGKK